jgi:hypothetical protein
LNTTPRYLVSVLALLSASASVSLIACSNDPSGSPVDDAGASVDASLDATMGTTDAAAGDASDAAATDAESGDGAPGTLCTPDAGRCTGTPSVDAERCDENGVWQPQGACPYACQAGACIGVCGAGSTQCCEKFDDGTVGCTNTQITPCTSGDTCPTPHPAAVVVRTCNAVGEWEETSTCQSACAPDPDRVIVGCGICNGAATCLQNVSESCACAAQ